MDLAAPADLARPDLAVPDLLQPDLAVVDLRPPPDLAIVPTCNDKMKNGSETDVDCGGTCGPCNDNGMCMLPADCASGQCNGGKCGWDYLWTYDEGAGTEAKDSGPKAAHGKLAGGTTWTTGKLGGALSFNKGRVEVPASVFACPEVPELTLLSWINYAGPQADDWQAIFVKSGLWEFGIFDDTEQLCFWDQGRYVLCTPFTAANYKDKWTQVGVTVDGATDTIRLYINGAQVAEGKFGKAKIPCGPGLVYHGAWDPTLASPEYVAGVLDHIRLSLRALTAAEIDKVYKTDGP